MTQHSKLLTTALIRYTISAVAFTLFHILSSPQTPNGGLRFFVKSKYVLWEFTILNVLTSCRKHPLYLNGRVVFLIFSQIVHGLLFLLRNVLLGRSVIGWKPTNSVSPLSHRSWCFPNTLKRSESDLSTKLFALVVTVPVFGVFCTSVQLVLFALGRAVVLPILFKIPFISHLLRPFAGHFLRGYTPVLLFTQIPTIVRALFLGITTLASWEVSETLFDASASEACFTFPVKRTALTVQITANQCNAIHGGTLCYPYFRNFFWGRVLQAFRVPRVGTPIRGPLSRSCGRQDSVFRRPEVQPQPLVPPLQERFARPREGLPTCAS